MELFKCNTCFKKFKSKLSLEKHLVKKHNEPLENQKEPKEANRKKLKKLPIAKKVNVDWFKCNTCGKKFKLKLSLENHFVKKHNGP